MFIFEPKVKLTEHENEIAEFEKQPVKKGLVMFYGDSGFTRWEPKYGNIAMEDAIRGKDGKQAVVNHGFGGSTAEELLYYYDRAVVPWAPRALVMKMFGNDAGAGYTPLEIMFLEARIVDYARRDFPGIKFYLCNTVPQLRYVSLPSSRHLHMKEYNDLLRDYCAKHDDCVYVDQMNDPRFYKDPARAGEFENVLDDIFIEDRGHMNVKGYELYRDFFIEKLSDVL